MPAKIKSPAAATSSKNEIDSQREAVLRENEKKMQQMIDDTYRAQAKIAINRSYLLVKKGSEVVRVEKISEHWLQNIELMPFFPLDNRIDSSVEAQKERDDALELVSDDLEALLKLKFHIFWSQVVYDPSVRKFLDSYLQYRLRRFDGNGCLSFTSLDQLISKRVLLLLLRLASYQENEENFMDRDAHAALIYDNWLFDIPKLMDIACIYGSTNETVCRQLISNVFHAQPKYFSDLEGCIPEMEASLTRALDAFNGKDTNTSVDAALFILDAVLSLHSFLRIYPAASPCYANRGFHLFLVEFYSRLVSIKSGLREVLSKDHEKKCRAALLDVVNDLFRHSLLSPIAQAKGFKKSTAVDGLVSFINFLCNGREDRDDSEPHTVFLRDVIFRHNWVERIKPCDVDPTVGEFLVRQLSQYQVKTIQRKTNQSASASASASASSKPNKNNKNNKNNSNNSTKTAAATAAATATVNANNNNNVKQILEVFPDSNPKFLLACLEAFNDNPERVMDALLSESLPLPLQELRDRMMAEQLDEEQQQQQQQEEEPSSRSVVDAVTAGLLAQRSNVFQGDDFDLDSGNFDKSRVYVKGRPESFGHVLGDAEDASVARDKIRQWSEWGGYAPEPEEEENDENDNYKVDDNEDNSDIDEYEDDFDDSYEDFVRIGFAEEETSDPTKIAGSEEEDGQQQQRPKRVVVGQTKQAQFKDRHKAAIANHNRRRQHDRKMSRGLFSY